MINTYLKNSSQFKQSGSGRNTRQWLTTICSDLLLPGHGNLGEVLGPFEVACKGTKAKQEELGSSLSVDKLAKETMLMLRCPPDHS